MMTKKIKEQILAIRDSGETNMLDTRTVQWIANREGYYELVIYLEDNSREYWLSLIHIFYDPASL